MWCAVMASLSCRQRRAMLHHLCFMSNTQALGVYNLMADLMDLKLRCQAAINGPSYPWRFWFKLAVPELNKEIGLLRRQGLKLHKYVLNVENGKALNEPTQWQRD